MKMCLGSLLEFVTQRAFFKALFFILDSFVVVDYMLLKYHPLFNFSTNMGSYTGNELLDIVVYIYCHKNTASLGRWAW